MITKEAYEQIKEQLNQWKYHSMEYTAFEAIKEYKILHNSESLILLYGYDEESKLYQFHWAANTAKELINQIKETQTKGLLTFVPKEWVGNLQEANFKFFAVWNDYFSDDIERFGESREIEYLKNDEYKIASEITLACKGQSRGFSGQTSKWVKEWLEGKEPALPSYARNSDILVKKIQNKVVGIICVATYAHESEKGAILWLREVAVHPDYQDQGIGRELIKQAYQYGKQLGCTRAFLMADECNEQAIHLYESMGFRGNKDEAEINMINGN